MKYIWAKTALTEQGWQDSIRIGITQTGHIGSVSSGPPDGCEKYSIILPAMVNLHSHTFQRAMAGLTESGVSDTESNFWGWRQLMYRFLEQLTPDDVQTIAQMAFLEMLECGYASVAEFHYLHHGPCGQIYDNIAELASRIIAAAQNTGIGLTLLPVIYEQGGCNGRPLEDGQLRFGNSVDQFFQICEKASTDLKHSNDDYVLGTAIHSLRAVGISTFQSVIERSLHMPMHIHVAEQQTEIQEVMEAFGARPVEWLIKNADLGKHWCLIHCTQMLAMETELLAKSGAVAGLCPVTESNLGDGTFDGVRYLNAGGTFGIGTDSNVNISQCNELRTFEYSQRLKNAARQQISNCEQSTGRTLFGYSCKGGAQASGRGVGVIKSGVWADFMELDENNTTLAGLSGNKILDAWIFSGNDRIIRNVWSAGRHVVIQGCHRDREYYEPRYRALQKRLRDLF